MRIDLFTLFPAMFEGPLTESMLKRAQEHGLLEINIHNIRDYATDKHHVTDEPPYGGGGGMVMKVDPIVTAVEMVLGESRAQVPVILTTPQGRLFDQALARELAEAPRLAFICGHYEGMDDRVRALVVTDEISIGDYVLTGGELAALVVIDAAARLLPGVLGDEESAYRDSFGDGLLDHPHYTRPAEFRGMKVPDALLSGNHAEIEKWRRREALRATLLKRPELLETAELTGEDQKILEELKRELQGN